MASWAEIKLISKLLIATSNPGKLREIKSLLKNQVGQVLSLNDVLGSKAPEVAETGQTYLENALLKAKTIAQLTQLPTLADDSGLEVIALDNFPGINSARWHLGDDADHNLALLKKMRNVSNRNARYVTEVVIYYPKQQRSIQARGELKGKIALKPTERSIGGFGYDSIFIPDGFNQPLAELGDNVKLKISHRTLALKALIKIINEQ